MKKSLDLHVAKKKIGRHLRRLEGESVALEEALFRLPVASIRADKPHPGYNQSTRDGFVVSAECDMRQGDGWYYKIGGEIAAGSIVKRRLKKGAAFRIMTGALVPAGAVRVIPQEECKERNGSVLVLDSAFREKSFFIRKKGCDIKKGKIIVSAGKPILPGHLVLLAATGHSRVLVHRRPRVCFFCTGSELVATPTEEIDGLKVSGNRYLLNSLVQMAESVPNYMGTVSDAGRELDAAFNRIDSGTADVILSTGGMGPGKYDLLEEAFTKAGGKIIYRSLNVRPGKATLFGLLEKTLFFGLPGPPPAVSVLFNELVRPALLFLQGMKNYQPREIHALLQNPVVLKKTGVPSFKTAMIHQKNGRYFVRLSEKDEVPDGYILIPGHRRKYKKEDMVKVHLTASSPFSF